MRNKLLIVLLLFGILFLSGCWDVEEINRRATANAVFFDQGDQFSSRIGVAIHVPGSLMPPVVGTTQEFEKRHHVFSGEGNSLMDAWSELQSNTMRNIFLGQVHAIILSDKAAGENLNNLLDFIGRRFTVPPDANILVTKSDPKELLDLSIKNNFVPGEYIKTYFESILKSNLALPTSLWEVYRMLDNGTSDPVMPLIEPAEGQYRIAGVAVFSQGQMVGELTLEENKILALLKDTASGNLTVPDGGKYVSFSDVNSKTKIEPRFVNNELIFEVMTDISARISEINPRKEVTATDQKRFERLAEEYTKKRLEELLLKLQGLNADAVGFGGKFRMKHPDKWDKDKWHEAYPAVKFNVKTKFTIQRTGLFR